MKMNCWKRRRLSLRVKHCSGHRLGTLMIPLQFVALHLPRLSEWRQKKNAPLPLSKWRIIALLSYAQVKLTVLTNVQRIPANNNGPLKELSAFSGLVL